MRSRGVGGWSYLLIEIYYRGDLTEENMDAILKGWVGRLYGVWSLAEMGMRVMRAYPREGRYIVRVKKGLEGRLRTALTLLGRVEDEGFNAVVIAASGTLKSCTRRTQQLPNCRKIGSI